MELFIKRFIDLLDEIAPVSMVHTLVEQPLGAVINESYVKIHSRLDLTDEDSPFVEIELHPYTYDAVNILYAYTFPASGIKISEEQFIAATSNSENVFVEKVTPINNQGQSYYELFYDEEIKLSKNHGEIDQQIHNIILVVMNWLSAGGYIVEKED